MSRRSLISHTSMNSNSLALNFILIVSLLKSFIKLGLDNCLITLFSPLIKPNNITFTEESGVTGSIGSIIRMLVIKVNDNLKILLDSGNEAFVQTLSIVFSSNFIGVIS